MLLILRLETKKKVVKMFITIFLFLSWGFLNRIRSKVSTICLICPPWSPPWHAQLKNDADQQRQSHAAMCQFRLEFTLSRQSPTGGVSLACSKPSLAKALAYSASSKAIVAIYLMPSLTRPSSYSLSSLTKAAVNPAILLGLLSESKQALLFFMYSKALIQLCGGLY